MCPSLLSLAPLRTDSHPHLFTVPLRALCESVWSHQSNFGQGQPNFPKVHPAHITQLPLLTPSSVFCFYSIAWRVLRAVQNLFGATLFLRGTAVTAPPFFDKAGRINVLYLHPNGEIQESPSFWYSTAHGSFFLLFSLKWGFPGVVEIPR